MYGGFFLTSPLLRDGDNMEPIIYFSPLFVWTCRNTTWRALWAQGRVSQPQAAQQGRLEGAAWKWNRCPDPQPCCGANRRHP